ncbi:hypothetical protein E3U36_00720 [Arsenophonus endosymbiont of Aphis craccivora]|uniref:hypothetical protein n=1 Tax=Arsenophonus endosymbiont of Aphis craccivora TaxID=1231049 RepID=UPI0015DC9599|nr:hypothetical protein [Arsenophonus endosymbiont of Aphis craccivora]QLK87088.1 hypothetical protein E3U36_00720 [Arsenophonus endosymbiont of Aphis craccivora]
MKLNIIKLLITTLLFISAAFAFELIVGHVAHADAVIDPQIKCRHGELGNIHLGGQDTGYRHYDRACTYRLFWGIS